MFKFVAIVVLAIIACVAGKAEPGIVAAPLAYSAPLVSAPYVASPYASAYSAYSGYSAPLIAAPYSAYSAYSAYPYAAAPFYYR